MKPNTIRSIFLAGLWLALLATQPALAQIHSVTDTTVQPVRVTDYDGTVWGLALGVEAGGRVHLLWTGERTTDENFTAFYASSLDGITWSSYQILDTGNAFDPQIAVDDVHERVHLLYRSNQNGIMHRVVAGGVVSDAIQVGVGVFPKLAVDVVTGFAYAFWMKWNDTYTAVRPYYAIWNGLSWSTPVEMTKYDLSCASQLGVAAEPGGGVMLAWMEDCDPTSGGGVIKTAYAANGVDFGLPQRVNPNYDWPQTDDSITLAYAPYDNKFHLLTDHLIWPGQSDIYHFVSDGTNWSSPQNVTVGSSPYWSGREFIGSVPALPALYYTWMESGENVGSIYSRQGIGEGLLPIRDVGYPFLKAGVLLGTYSNFLDHDGALHLAVGESAYDYKGVYYLRHAPPVIDSGIIPPGGGVFSVEDGSKSYIFPSGAFTQTVLLAHTPLEQRDQPSTWPLVSINHSFGVTAVYSNTGQLAQLMPGQVFTVTLDYTTSGTTSDKTLALWWWDESTAAWSQKGITSTVDVNAKRVTAQVSHLSIFSVLGETQRVYLPLTLR